MMGLFYCVPKAERFPLKSEVAWYSTGEGILCGALFKSLRDFKNVETSTSVMQRVIQMIVRNVLFIWEKLLNNAKLVSGG
ncbi:hypothetical protein VNO77_34308 [Canavalia gladiata]|uniref:Uncharacterized protein n=1 Tax=Canavalia gladiata TaxID=3824 RepID=A0AAN9PZ53_CANGL